MTTEVFNLVAHLERQREFSLVTFGPGKRLAGVLAHIRKELSEIEASPHDIMEWADLLLLSFDGAWRQGFEPGDIVAAIAVKLAINEHRDWPDWRTSNPEAPLEHIRTADSVPAEIAPGSVVSLESDCFDLMLLRLRQLVSLLIGFSLPEEGRQIVFLARETIDQAEHVLRIKKEG